MREVVRAGLAALPLLDQLRRERLFNQLDKLRLVHICDRLQLFPGEAAGHRRGQRHHAITGLAHARQALTDHFAHAFRNAQLLGSRHVRRPMAIFVDDLPLLDQVGHDLSNKERVPFRPLVEGSCQRLASGRTLFGRLQRLQQA